MRKIAKGTFEAFVKFVDRALLNLGATKFVFHEKETFRDEVPGYKIETRFGELVLHPSYPIANPGEKKEYDLTVFGLFSDAERGKAGTGHWKWNHHFGYYRKDQADIPAAILANDVRKLLPTAA